MFWWNELTAYIIIHMYIHIYGYVQLLLNILLVQGNFLYILFYFFFNFLILFPLFLSFYFSFYRKNWSYLNNQGSKNSGKVSKLCRHTEYVFHNTCLTGMHSLMRLAIILLSWKQKITRRQFHLPLSFLRFSDSVLR